MNDADEDIWSFCLRFYARPGVSAACLALQEDHGADVVLLLYLLFLARARRSLAAEAVGQCNQAAQAWREAVIQPLRRVRGTLKSAPAAYPRAGALRKSVAAAEMDAERMQLQRLAACEFPSQQAATAVAAARASLAAYCAHLGLPLDSTVNLLTLFAGDVKE